MLAYRHLFHAGNFADVFKHALLVRMLEALGRKDKPYLYLDTHAGTGLYDLGHEWAQKAREYDNGIGRIWQREDAPEALRSYLQMVRQLNPGRALRRYPGSPWIARSLLRPGDRMLLTELNKADAEELERRFAGDRQVRVETMDGYQALKAHLPPPERRGLVLVDSGFDRAGEFARLVAALKDAHRRWATGMYAIWYPLMQPAAMQAFEREVQESGIRRVLKLELALHPENWAVGMRGCGMLIVNPPWTLEQEARPLLDWLWRQFSPEGKGGRAVAWLVPEDAPARGEPGPGHGDAPHGEHEAASTGRAGGRRSSPASRRRGQAVAVPNREVNAQTRKVLGAHYRAKYRTR